MASNEMDDDRNVQYDDKISASHPVTVLVGQTNIKKSKKLIQALNLPTVMNVNPRSVYNKADEFKKFVEEEKIDCVFMSESWERPDKPLNDLIDLPSHTIISNPHQRKEIGGRPALIINNEKYIVQNLTQSVIDIPWGVEATWAIPPPCDSCLFL